ncbi:CDP-glucose 4,6-dehydratase [Cysteiniphilum halobium]|uniref:CDP-glucose 4,6-dehydratase n=1 Tax=Cysteiniphilum halobium TaxID=2219059 RepID=UPI000E64AB40|nr:CDP-glucose 4,6-dehydratase [Cysteiniphilum halobium]
MNKAFWKSKKILVTGHTGFKGTWMSLWLNSSGAKVYGYALEPNTEPSLFKLLRMDNRIDHFIGDIRDLDAFKARIINVQPDIIIHMAAQPLVRYSYENPVETYQTNIMGTVNLFESVRVCNSVKVVVNVTTDKCYENKEWEWGYREYEPMGGYDPYSSSKGCSELITSSYRYSYFNPAEVNKHGKAVASARAGNVIGGGDWAKDRLIPDVIGSFIKQEIVNIRNPAAIRPWQHVLEPLSGYLLLAEKMWHDPKQYAEAWNFGPLDSDVKDVKYIVEYLATHWHQNVEWRFDESKQPHEAKFLKLDISKAKTYLGWQPRWSLEQTLKSIIEWYDAYSCGKDMFELTLAQIKAFESKNC